MSESLADALDDADRESDELILVELEEDTDVADDVVVFVLDEATLVELVVVAAVETLEIAKAATTRTEDVMMDKQQRQKKQRKRIKGGVPYSSQLLRRKRLETQTLQLEAEELTVQLAELQAGRDDIGGHRNSKATARREDESRAQGDTDRANEALRSVCDDTGKNIALEGMEFVFNLQPKVERPLVEIAFSDKVVEEMSISLDWLRLDTDTILAGVDSISNVSFRWQNLPTRNCMESSSITPVGCSAQEVGDMLWRHATNTKKETDKAFRYVQRNTPNPLDMNAVAPMFEALLCIGIVSTFRKYDEGNRIILVGTTKWFLPTGELLLQDYNWTVLSPSPAEPLCSCVMKIFYKLEMVATVSDRAAESQQMLFHAVSDKMRGFYQSMQDNLLSNDNLANI